jgi:hypothetical protein
MANALANKGLKGYIEVSTFSQLFGRSLFSYIIYGSDRVPTVEEVKSLKESIYASSVELGIASPKDSRVYSENAAYVRQLNALFLHQVVLLSRIPERDFRVPIGDTTDQQGYIPNE